MQYPRLAVLFALGLAFACASKETSSGGPPRIPATGGAAAGSGGAPKAGSGPISIPNGDGGIVPITPITPLPEAGSSGQMLPKLSTEPISIDECGANNPAGLSDADRQKLMAAAQRFICRAKSLGLATTARSQRSTRASAMATRARPESTAVAAFARSPRA